jgi:hypothetical protein
MLRSPTTPSRAAVQPSPPDEAAHNTTIHLGNTPAGSLRCALADTITNGQTNQTHSLV